MGLFPFPSPWKGSSSQIADTRTAYELLRNYLRQGEQICSLSICLTIASALALQLISIPVGDKGIYVKHVKLHINSYTAPAIASIALAITNGAIIALW